MSSSMEPALYREFSQQMLIYLQKCISYHETKQYMVSQKEVPPTFEKSLKKNPHILWLKYWYGSKVYYVFGVLWQN